MQMAGFTSCFSIVRTHHHVICSVNGILLFQSNLIDMLLHSSLPRHIRSPTLSTSSHFKIQCFSQNITIIPSQNMPIPSHSTRLASSTKVSFKPSKLISSWHLFFSINLTPHVALTIAFSVFKIAISFSLKHHMSFP